MSGLEDEPQADVEPPRRLVYLSTAPSRFGHRRDPRAPRLRRPQSWRACWTDRLIGAVIRFGALPQALEALGLEPGAALPLVEREPEVMARVEDAIRRWHPEHVRGEVTRRGVEGVLRPVVSAGRVVAEALEYDGKALEMAAKAAKPDLYGPPRGSEDASRGQMQPLIVFAPIVPVAGAALPTLRSAQELEARLLEGGGARQREEAGEASQREEEAAREAGGEARAGPIRPPGESHPSARSGPISGETV